MIVGLGTDIAEIERIEASLRRFGERFLHRVFTEGERLYCLRKPFPAQSLAARFAAKEAAAKALGTGISRGIGWRDIEVMRAPGRAPGLLLHGRARTLAEQLGARRSHVSLTHTAQTAMAVVILETEALPGSPE